MKPFIKLVYLFTALIFLHGQLQTNSSNTTTTRTSEAPEMVEVDFPAPSLLQLSIQRIIVELILGKKNLNQLAADYALPNELLNLLPRITIPKTTQPVDLSKPNIEAIRLTFGMFSQQTTLQEIQALRPDLYPYVKWYQTDANAIKDFILYSNVPLFPSISFLRNTYPDLFRQVKMYLQKTFNNLFQELARYVNGQIIFQPSKLSTNPSDTFMKFIKNIGINLNGDNIPPLLFAIIYKYTAFALQLIEFGADVDITYKSTPILAYAVRSRNIPIIKALLDKGAYVNAQWPYDIPTHSNNLIGAVIINPITHRDDDALDAEIIRLLLAKGATPNFESLNLAVLAKNHIAKLLLDNGANPVPGSKSSSDSYSTLLHVLILTFHHSAIVMAFHFQNETLEQLLANLKAETLDLAEKLLNKGVDPRIIDNNGKIAAQLADEFQFTEFANRLRGAALVNNHIEARGTLKDELSKRLRRGE